MVQVIHASCVAFARQGVLILGASGSGKSALALQLLALGADLVADDRVALHAGDGVLLSCAPPGLPAMIEARGVGLLRAPLLAQARLALVVDLDRQEDARLPPLRNITLLDVTLPLVHGARSGHFAAAIRQHVLCGRGD